MLNWFGWPTFSNQTVGNSADSRIRVSPHTNVSFAWIAECFQCLLIGGTIVRGDCLFDQGSRGVERTMSARSVPNRSTLGKCRSYQCMSDQRSMYE
jgi:hypothetical protein